MRVASPFVYATLFVAQLPAQEVTVTASVVTPTNVTATSGTMVKTSSTAAAGYVSLSALLAPGLGAPGVALVNRRFSVVSDGEASRAVSYEMNGLITGAPGSAVVDSHESIIELTAPAPRSVELAIDMNVNMPAGAAVPRLDFDLGDDGTLDSPGIRTVIVGPVPYRIRVTGDFELTGAGVLPALGSVEMSMTIRPDNDVYVQQVVAGCADTPFEVFEPFAIDGIEVNAAAGTDPMLVVFGFGAQPTLLPQAGATPFPCLLYPTVDVVAVLPGDGLELPIPQAVRPATLFVQGVSFAGLSLLQPTDGYFVSAF